MRRPPITVNLSCRAWLGLWLGAGLAAAGAGCRDDTAYTPAQSTALIAADPVIARALNDPLMSDPDLASRNEANAALGFADSQALPVIPASSAEASAAREALRLDLLTDGPIPDLPRAVKPAAGSLPLRALGPMASAQQLLAAAGANPACAARLREDFALAASLPSVAVLPPQGMVMQAGGVDSPGCRVRIIRYVSAAAPEEVLQYHYAKARRAGLKAARYAQPEPIILATGTRKGTGATLAVHARKAAHGLTSVDLIYNVRAR